MNWVVYIIECKDRSLYTGITNDLESRLAAHQAGVGAKYTRGRGPFQLVFSEKAADRSAATRREAEIKRMPKAAKAALIDK
ncbi:GIY-YIG nuclease family protein [Alphaproteobacteria bacterium]|jgi:putative endonuclease|nr:GIY-YIG nuclease family protein [Alphaproteobacteria bacterium]